MSDNSAYRDLSDLSPRVQNILWNRKISDRDSLREAFLSGKLHPIKTRNFGWKSYREIAKFLGEEPHMARSKTERRRLAAATRIVNEFDPVADGADLIISILKEEGL